MEIQKIFSNVEDPEENLYSVLMSENEVALFSELQKEFNSKAQKALRSVVDTSIGRNWHKEASKFFKPELVGKGSVVNYKNIGRELQRTPQVDVKTLHGRINKKGAIRNLQKKGLIDEWTANNTISATNRRTNPF